MRPGHKPCCYEIEMQLVVIYLCAFLVSYMYIFFFIFIPYFIINLMSWEYPVSLPVLFCVFYQCESH